MTCWYFFNFDFIAFLCLVSNVTDLKFSFEFTVHVFILFLLNQHFSVTLIYVRNEYGFIFPKLNLVSRVYRFHKILTIYVRRSFAGGKCSCKASLDRKVIIITGANSGIGKATALELAQRGAHVVLACRNLVAAEKTREWILNATGNESITCIRLDLNSFRSIHQFVDEFKRGFTKLHCLVNNAGVFYFPKRFTEDGFDVTFQTNYLGPFYLTNLLLDVLLKSAPSRIVNVASNSHRLVKELDLDNVNFSGVYDYFMVYGQSKLCLILLTYKLAEKLGGCKVSVSAVDPGNVETNIFRHFPYLNNPLLFAIQKPIRLLVVKTPEEGAQSVLHAILRSCGDKNVAYIRNCEECLPSELSQRRDLMDKLWNKSAQWCNI